MCCRSLGLYLTTLSGAKVVLKIAFDELTMKVLFSTSYWHVGSSF